MEKSVYCKLTLYQIQEEEKLIYLLRNQANGFASMAVLGNWLEKGLKEFVNG